MVAGKARESATLESLVLKNAAGIELLKAMLRDKEGFSSTESRSIGLAGGNTLPGAAGFLETGGDTMIGPIAYFPRLQGIEAEDNSLDISRERGDTFTSRVIVSAASETILDYIHGAAHAGQQLELQGILTETYTIRESRVDGITNIVGLGTITVTIADTTGLATGDYVSIKGTTNFEDDLVKITVTGGTTFTYAGTGSATPETSGNSFRGNIRTHLDANIVVIDNQDYMLTFDSIANEWVVKGAEGGTVGGVSFPITPTIDDRSDTWSGTQNINLSAATAHVLKIILDQNLTLTFSVPPSSGTQIEFEVEITQNGTGGFTVTWPGSVAPTPIVSTVANAKTIVTLRTNDGGSNYQAITGGTFVGTGDASLWANFDAVSDIDANTFDIFDVDRLLFVVDSGSIGSTSDIAIWADASGDLQHNVATGDVHGWRVNDAEIGQFGKFGGSLDSIFVISSVDNATPFLRLIRRDTTPSAGATVAGIEFFGVDSSGATDEQFGKIRVDGEDLTIGSVDGSMHLQVEKASLPVTFLSLNNTNNNKITFFKNLILDAGIDIELDGNDLIFDSTGTNLINADSAGMDIHADGAGDTISMIADGVTSSFSSTGLQLGLTADQDMAFRALQFSQTTATFLIDGAMYYNDTLNQFEVRENGVTKSITGGSGANAALSNLVSVAINTALLPSGDGTLDFGSSSFTWKDAYFLKYRIETGGSSVVNINQITADAGGLLINTPSGDAITLRFNGNDNIFFEEDRIEFQVGRAHRIDAQVSSIDITAENLTDSVKLITGTGRSNENVKIEDFKTTFFTDTTETAAMALQLVQNNDTPVAFRTIVNIDMIAENSASVDTIYARISASSQDPLSTSEDGLLQLGIVSGGTLIAAIDIEGSSSGGANDALIGFFGETPVAQQSVASDTLANLYTALRNLGLIV